MKKYFIGVSMAALLTLSTAFTVLAGGGGNPNPEDDPENDPGVEVEITLPDDEEDDDENNVIFFCDLPTVPRPDTKN